MTDSAPIPVAFAEPADAVLAPMPLGGLLDEWERFVRRFVRHLRGEVNAAWVQGLRAMAAALVDLQGQDPDVALYLLLQGAAHEVDSYSARHALACAVVADLAAAWLEWTDEEREAARLAALSMNISMTAMQDTLAQQVGEPTEDDRRHIADHPAASAELLREAGVDDLLWLQAVRHHHRATESGSAGRADRVAELLRRVDVYTAKLSRRRTRDAASPALAARDACLGPAGVPDAVGATMLRVLGLYPPGTFVALASGEVGVVVRRGDKAHTPMVAALRRADGGVYMPPVCRDTSLRTHAVTRGLRATAVRVRVNPLRTLACAR